MRLHPTVVPTLSIKVYSLKFYNIYLLAFIFKMELDKEAMLCVKIHIDVLTPRKILKKVIFIVYINAVYVIF